MAVSLDVISRVVAEPNFLFDTVWDGFVGDWAPAKAPGGADFTYDFVEEDFGGPSFNPTGGFRALAPLHTAILLCLMSDARASDEEPIPDGSGDPRGWAGDAIDPTLAPLGSKLWLLRRRELTEEVAGLSVVYATEAIQTLIDQGAAAEFKISAAPNYAEGRLELTIEAYRESATRATTMNFWLLWKAANGVSSPLAP
jgi:phage gp46-like protein